MTQADISSGQELPRGGSYGGKEEGIEEQGEEEGPGEEGVEEEEVSDAASVRFVLLGT
ncbi:MAG TPA: hypothetical protein VKW76_05850 [Candidatus Binatia bacterium]|nr:hypothetical protein [Candidatus Binatia bacterium]